MNRVYKRSGSHYPNLRRGEQRRRKMNGKCAAQRGLGSYFSNGPRKGSFMRLSEVGPPLGALAGLFAAVGTMLGVPSARRGL